MGLRTRLSPCILWYNGWSCKTNTGSSEFSTMIMAAIETRIFVVNFEAQRWAVHDIYTSP
jgi:hypothetical protein